MFSGTEWSTWWYRSPSFFMTMQGVTLLLSRISCAAGNGRSWNIHLTHLIWVHKVQANSLKPFVWKIFFPLWTTFNYKGEGEKVEVIVKERKISILNETDQLRVVSGYVKATYLSHSYCTFTYSLTLSPSTIFSVWEWYKIEITERDGSVVTHETRIREVPGSNPGADQPDWGFFVVFLSHQGKFWVGFSLPRSIWPLFIKFIYHKIKINEFNKWNIDNTTIEIHSLLVHTQRPQTRYDQRCWSVSK